MTLAELEIGQELPELVISSVDPEKMKLMAALLRDPNPIHFDADSVRELGLGDRPVNQGPSNLSYLLQMVGRWAEDMTRIEDVAVRFLGNVFAGDRVVCRGQVAAVDADSVSLEVEALVEDRAVLQGTVVVSR